MALINLDFSNVKEISNLSVGRHALRITKAEQKTASTGSPMLVVNFVNAQGEVGIDNFVLTEAALWRTKQLLEAAFKTPQTGVIQLNTDLLIGKTVEAIAKEEEYMKQDGTPGIRTVLENYRPVSETSDMGIAPSAPVFTPAAPATPVAPVVPTPAVPTPAATPVVQAATEVVAQPVPAAAPVAPAVPEGEAPARPKRPWE